MTNDTSKTIEIPLTKGYVAIVDECDADLAEMKWYTQNPNRRPYAARQKRIAPYKQKTMLMHIIIAERIINRPVEESEQIDHKDGNSLNNSRDNLRITNGFGNAKNRKRSKSNTSGFKGVHYNSQNHNWVARISVDGKRLSLGSYNTPELAYDAYCKAAIKYHGEFARLK